MIANKIYPLAILPFLLFLTMGSTNLVPHSDPQKDATFMESCNNGIDDDNDGLIDLNDPDCECQIIEPVSLIPNPSFEEMNCCPNNRSQLNCAVDWIQASEPTTDYLHTCDWMGWENFPPPLPFPDGQGIMGFRDGRVRQNNIPEKNWKEYAGACLLSPLVANNTYRFEFDVGFVNYQNSPPINITFFGTTDCENLPFGVGNEALGCPTNGPGWVKLGSTLVSGNGQHTWIKASIDVVPEEDITAIAIGPPCTEIVNNISTYYFFDNLLLADFRSFELVISATSHPCQDDFAMQIPDFPEYSYQWYKEGVALVGETSNQLSGIYGEGNYQVLIDDGASCRVTTNFSYAIPILSNPVSKTICNEEVYPFGDRILDESGTYVDTFKSVNNCDSIVFLDLKILGTLADTLSVRIFAGESYQYEGNRFRQEGDHLINLESTLGCDSLVLLQLDYYHVFVPNVFSPNNDGVNDVFKVFSEQGLVQSSKLVIFDRWGAQIYSGDQWDGSYNGDYALPGVYTYFAQLIMESGLEHQLSGSVTVIR